jgi:Fe-S cluster biogenesis protein NfuA
VRLGDVEVRTRIEALEALLGRIADLPGEGRALASAAVKLVVELYGAALGRLLALAPDGALAASAVRDELLAHLMLLHDLHPEETAARVERALAAVRPTLAAHGGDVELLAIADGTVRLRLTGSCDGCPSSAATMRLAIEQAIREHAPEIESVEADGLAAPDADLVQVEPLPRERTNGEEVA